MKWQAMFKGNYINASEFDGKKPTVTIEKVTLTAIEGDDGTAKEKCVIMFKDWKRGFVPSPAENEELLKKKQAEEEERRRKRAPWGVIALVLLTGLALIRNGSGEFDVGPPQPARALGS